MRPYTPEQKKFILTFSDQNSFLTWNQIYANLITVFKTTFCRELGMKSGKTLQKFCSRLSNTNPGQPTVRESILKDIQAKTTHVEDLSHKSKNKELLSMLQEKELQISELLDIDSNKYKPHPIISDTLHRSEATAVIVASDWHIEEIVDPDTINGINEYNPQIAEQRVKNFFKNGLRLTDIMAKEINISNILMCFLGDFMSGYIHEELIEGNAMSPTEAVIFIRQLICDGLNYMLANSKYTITAVMKYGNHCVRSDTEILTNKGFVIGSELKGDEIISTFDKSTGDIEYSKIETFKKFIEKGYYKIYGDNKKEYVTSGHNLILDGNFVKASDLNDTNKISQFRFCGNSINPSTNYSDNELILITQIVTDGTIVDRSKYNEPGFRIQFKLSKDRKIVALQKLLTDMGLKFTIRKATMSGGNILQPYLICLYGKQAKYCVDLLQYKGDKVFPTDFQHLTRRQIDIVIRTILFTDGRLLKKSIEWSSIKKANIDIIQIACISNGIPFKYKLMSRTPGSGFDNAKDLYVSLIYPDGYTSIKYVHKDFIEEDAEFIAIGAKLGTIITRVDGIVNFTGNSRTTEKIRVSTGYKNSYEWMLYHFIAGEFKNNSRIKFVIENGYHTYQQVYGYTLRLHHGDAIQYGGGVGGITIPANKAIAQWNQTKHADLDVLGHFHTLLEQRNFVTNGSLIGFNAYANRIKATFEEPKQTFFLIDRDRGRTITAPIFVTDIRK